MKKIFRKAITVLASTALIGMTVGTAFAASYPSPFTSNTAIVVGANAAPSDNIAASSIASNLDASSAGTGTVITTGDGDSYQIEKTSTKFHLGDMIGNITTSNLDEDQLPTLLAKGKYIDSDNEEFDYTQKIRLNDVNQLKMFNDNDYAKDTPTLGFRLTNEVFILNYTLDFTDKPTFDKLATTDIPFMGKDYYVLSVNSANDTLTLLDSADSALVAEGETTTLNIDGTSYVVSISFIGASTVKLTINGETTNSLSAGQTQRLIAGSYVGIKEVLYTSKDTSVSKVEFSIGSGKLKIQDGQKVEINDEDVKNVYGYIQNSSLKLNKIVLKWTADDETFITKDDSITMPGFEAVSMSFSGVEFPTEETIVVSAGGNDYAVLDNFPLAGGTIDIPILGKAAGNVNYTFAGSDTDELLITSSGSTISFNGSSSNNDEMFLVTWRSGTDAESYLVRATGFNDPSSSDDTVDFEYNDGSGWTKKYDNAEQGDEISFGQAEMTLTTLNSSTGNEAVLLTAAGSSNVVFDELYSKEGLMVQMPRIVTVQTDVLIGEEPTSCANWRGNATSFALTPITGAIAGYTDINVYNASAAVNVTCTYTQASFPLVFTEENKDGDNAAGPSFNITIGTSGSSNYYTSVTDVNNYTSTREKSDTDVYESWMYSALATKFVEDDSGDQDSVTITYHGEEVKAGVYITSPGVTFTTGLSVGVMTVKDSEVASVSGKNLVVIGGSAINSVAAELLGGAYSEAAFTSATGVAAGEFMIKSFSRAGNTALLVAGYNAADTEKAVTYLLNNDVDTSVDMNYKGTSATEASLVVA